MALTDAQSNATILQAIMPMEITLAGTVTKGDLIGYSAGWKRALATVGTAIHARLVALEDGVSADVITAAPAAVIGGGRFTAATPGGRAYLEEGTGFGKYTETAPSTVGDIPYPIGLILDATTIVVSPGFHTVLDIVV